MNVLMNSTKLMRHSIGYFLTFRISAFLFRFWVSSDCRPLRQHSARKKLGSGKYTEQAPRGLFIYFTKTSCTSSSWLPFWSLGPHIMLYINGWVILPINHRSIILRLFSWP